MPFRSKTPTQGSPREELRYYMQGGLGNQLFGLVAAWLLSAKSGAPLTIDFRFLRAGSNPHRTAALLDFELPLDALGRTIAVHTTQLSPSRARIESWLDRKVLGGLGLSYVSPNLGYDHLVGSDARRGSRVHGYFQNYRYAEEATDLGLDLRLKSRSQSGSLAASVIRAQHQNPIMVHVRRGDYVKHADSFGTLGSSYYQAAIRLLRDHGEDGPLWVLTDDPASVEMELSDLLGETPVVTSRNLGLTTAHEDFLLMRESKNLIIANSSFSWWAATMAGLGCNVVAPRPWFRALAAPDMLRPEWLQLAADFK